jgi:hypothetical protein
VRFADDFVVGFEHREDAERFWADLRDRLAKFNLELNAEKTRLVEFGRLAARDRKARGLRRPETFRSLGFTHACAKTKKGRFKLKRMTDSKRLQAKLRALKDRVDATPAPAHTRAGPLACQRPARTRQLLRRARQPRGAARLPLLRHRALVPGATASQSALTPDVEADAVPPSSIATVAADRPSLAGRPLRRSYPREEPSELAVHAGICAGGGSSSKRRPVPTAIRRPQGCRRADAAVAVGFGRMRERAATQYERHNDERFPGKRSRGAVDRGGSIPAA